MLQTFCYLLVDVHDSLEGGFVLPFESNHTEEMNVSPAPSRLTVKSIINYLVSTFSNTRIF